MRNSFCRNCGKWVSGYDAVLREVNGGTIRKISIWMDRAGLDTCPDGTHHESTKHPTVADSR